MHTELHEEQYISKLITPSVCNDTRIFSQSHPPPLINEHKHPFGLKNPKFHFFIFNYVLQLIFSIFRNNTYTSPFNYSTEGTLFKMFVSNST